MGPVYHGAVQDRDDHHIERPECHTHIYQQCWHTGQVSPRLPGNKVQSSSRDLKMTLIDVKGKIFYLANGKTECHHHSHPHCFHLHHPLYFCLLQKQATLVLMILTKQSYFRNKYSDSPDKTPLKDDSEHNPVCPAPCPSTPASWRCRC